MKYNGTLSKQQINQYTLIDYALMDRYTYYPSPLLVFGSNGYSKHYFIEGQRVMSRIGDVWDAEAALIPLDTTPDGVDLNNKADQIEAQLETHLACLALAGEVDYHVDLEWLGWETEPMVFFYHPDHLGSSSFITGATGEPTQHLEYLPFGELFIEERSTWNTPYKFSAKELDDETGYSYFGARYYDPNISIWLSVDPLSDEAPGWTPYRYCFNNPVNSVDKTGLFEDDITVDENGIITNIVRNDQPNRFFDQSTGKELKLNDAANNPNDQALLNMNFEVGNQVYQNLSHTDTWNFLLDAGFEPSKLKGEGLYGRYKAYSKVAELSFGGKADFPLVLLDNEKFNLDSKSTPDGKHMEITGLPFRINGSNTLYNPSDAGQFIWGAWMKANGFTETQVWLGSNLNEWKTGFDSAGDQRAIFNGYRSMAKFMNH